jgi:mono/diheme cytochrome c family protein
MSSIRVLAAAASSYVRTLWPALTIVAVLVSPAPVRGQGPSASERTPWVAPERASHRANPVPATDDAIKSGRGIFVRDCLQCHGKAGHGDGPQAGSLEIRPADLPSERVQSQTDGALFWKLTEGRGVMPKATLSDKDKWMVIDYIRTLAPKP